MRPSALVMNEIDARGIPQAAERQNRSEQFPERFDAWSQKMLSEKGLAHQARDSSLRQDRLELIFEDLQVGRMGFSRTRTR
jgi:hypothetical protein